MNKLSDIITERILILDGAMGSLIQEYGLKGNNDSFNLTHPDIISEIHERYLKAGADIITTNTFNAQRISQADYHAEAQARQMNVEGARLARRMADRYSTPEKPRFVAGSIGPTNKTCSMSPDVCDPAARDLTYDQLFDAYSEQIDGLVEGGVDALLIETIFDSLNAKAAIDAAMQVLSRQQRHIPIMLSVTISDLAGRTLSGQTLDAFLASISTYPIFSVGLNCSFGARQMKPYLKQLASRAPYYITAHPNAGLPNELGLYDETPESMAPQIQEFIDEGLVNIVGGCCGTTPDFIAQYVPLVSRKPPHLRTPAPSRLWLSGLDLLEIHHSFTNVGERCNVAGSRKFLRLIKDKNYDEAVSIARKQVSDGALVIDINMDDGLLDARHEMTTFLNMIATEPDIARVPVMIDSSNWEVIVAGLKCVQGKSIVNSISLKEGEDMFLSHARDVMRYGAAVVVMCFDEQGQATTYERRIEIARRAYRLLTEKVGMNPLDIIFDPNVLAIATGMEEHDNYATDFIRAAKWIRENLPFAHVSGGVSNLSFSFRGNNYIREAMHAVFLHHAIQAGMDFGIVNPATKLRYADIPEAQLTIIEDVVLNRRPSAAEDLIALAARLSAEAGREDSSRKEERGVRKEDSSRCEVRGTRYEDSSRKEEGGTRYEDSSAGEGDLAPRTSHLAPRETVPREALPVEQRLQQALIQGNGDHLQTDIDEALAKYPRAVDIIEGPLMAGMNEVGRLFGAGKMFLPQVVKTARTMKQAVAILQPYIEDGSRYEDSSRNEERGTRNEDSSRYEVRGARCENSSVGKGNLAPRTSHLAPRETAPQKAGKILLATVKGDVHDIGKNIVAVVMACNNYEVIDMGVMVPAEQIVKKAREEQVDMIGLSGLITPSLEEMVNVATELQRAGMNIPILIGGATTSKLHVALKIAPVYQGPVVWMKDASQNPLAAARLMGDETAVARQLDEEYTQLRTQYQHEQAELQTLDEARRNKRKLWQT